MQQPRRTERRVDSINPTAFFGVSGLNAGLLGVAPETHFDKNKRKMKTNIHLQTY